MTLKEQDKTADDIAEEVTEEVEKELTWKEEAEIVRKKFTFGEIVTLFNKTPPLDGPDSVFCPHFMELKFAYGCWYNCDWCYLLGHGRWNKANDFTDPRRPKLVGGTWSPTIKDHAKIKRHLDNALDTLDKPMMFNAGELSDSLVDYNTMLNVIIPIFEKYKDKGHKLLLLTKSDDTMLFKRAVKHYGPEFMVISHTINAEYVSRTYEKGTPNPLNRLAASRAAAELGYETRLRIDPMVPVNNWKIGYRKIAQEIIRMNSRVSVITLGTLSGLQNVINVGNKLKKATMSGHGKDAVMEWTTYLKENSDWGKKPALETRIEMYSYVINELKRLKYQGDISLCKETLEAWDTLHKAAVIDYGPGERMCNCVMKRPGLPDIYQLNNHPNPEKEE